MTRQSRRNFITSASLLTLGAAANAIPPQKDKSMVIHHVFFWLKDNATDADRDRLIEGVKELGKIETVRAIHVGVPAKTAPRTVIDASYAVTELLFFDDLAGQASYQDHPLHKKFVETYSSIFKKVIVYDSLTM